jgi:hypothetical protein
VHSRERESRKTPPVARHGGRDETNLSSGRLIEIYPSPRTHPSDPIGVGFEYGKKVPPGNLLINQGYRTVNKKASPNGEAFDFSDKSIT